MKSFLFHSRVAQLLLFAGLTLSISAAFTDTPDEILKRLVRQVTDYTETYAPEKVYLHTDQSHYAAGDDVWVKAYVVNAATHQPDSASGVLYVELLTAKGEALLTEKIKLTGGFGNGDLRLPDGLPTGNYQLRAYTRWMQNEPPDFFFTKVLTILNPNVPAAGPRPAGVPPKPPRDVVDVQFFPEGGDLVVGLTSTVAFKAVTKEGVGVPVRVRIVSSSGDTTAAFASLHAGMGTFAFQPEAGRTYRALVALPNGQVQTYSLPAAKPEGWIMHAENTPNACKLTLSSSRDAEEPCYLVAQTRGKVTYQATSRVINHRLTFEIPTGPLPTGLTQLTVFDATGTPQCERLIFIDHKDQIRLQLTSDKPVYAPREKVTLTLTARNAAGQPVAGNFSVSIGDAFGLASTEGSIVSNLLLTSDLKGHIENPEFYFQEGNLLAAPALDCLLLTQGWRRFSWQLVEHPSEPPFERETAITLTARLLDKNTNQPLPAKVLLLSAPGAQSVFRYGYTDQAGKIRLSSLDFYEYRNVFIGIYNPELYHTAKVVADSAQPTPGFVPFSSASFSIPAQSWIEQQKIRTFIRHTYDLPDGPAGVVVPAADTALHPVSPVYAKADEVLRLDDFTLFPTMAEVLRDIVPWGIVTNKKGQAGFRLLNLDTKLYFKQNPLYLIDNVPVHNIDPVLALDPAMVHTLECIRSGVGRSQFGEIGYSGVFCVFTKAGDFYPANEPGLYSFSVRGFAKARQFYAPTYATPVATHSQPDFRRLLYWNPTVPTDASGRATFSFYNSDDLTTWRAVAEGVSTNGQVGSGKLTYRVQLHTAK